MEILNLRVLLVDDDDAGAQSIHDMLAGNSAFSCERVRDVASAQHALVRNLFDVILFSLTLRRTPGLGGLAIMRSLAPSTPILALVDEGAETIALKAIQHGAAEYLIRSQLYPTLLVRSIRHTVEQVTARLIQEQTERALQRERDFSAAVIDTAGCLILVLDRHGRIMEFNNACERVTGYPSEQARGVPVWQLLPAHERQAAIAAFRRRMSGVDVHPLESDWIMPDGTKRVFAWSTTVLRGEDGTVDFIICAGLDVTERRSAEEALRHSESKYRTLFEQSRDAIFLADTSDRILEANPAMSELLGYTAGEMIGRELDTLFATPAHRDYFLRERATKGEVHDIEVQLQRRDGIATWFLFSFTERWLQGGTLVGMQGILHDISDRKRAEERLIHTAYHDALTGLPNRALFLDRLDRAIARWHRNHQHPFALLFLDLDRFKVINDSLGHTAGDRLLVRIGGLLQECVRDEDTVARLGGDEFAILLEEVENTTDAILVAERIHDRMHPPLNVSGHDVFTTCSIGIVLPGPEREKPEDHLRNADIAMYTAKAQGPAQHALYTPEMHRHALSILEIQTDLRVALREEQFILHYQPIFALATGSISGLEALIRWNHPRRGLLLPGDFIPHAEEMGLIVPIGRWVIAEACRQLQQWRAAQPKAHVPFVSVNVSGRQIIQPDFVSEVAGILGDRGLTGDSLMFEITETSLMENPDACAVMIRRLRDLGVRFCIDDFGTGYSSLSYLHRLPIDGLKIDRSFIERLQTTGNSEMVATIVSLASSLGLDAVAEGVETEYQLSSVRRLRPRYVQGYYLSRPLEPPQAGMLLRAVTS